MSENTIDYTMQYCTLASKEIMEANLSIADLDNESFDRLFDFFEAFIKKINFKMYNGILGLEAKCNNGDYYQYQYILYRLVRILKQVNSIWGMKSMLSILDDLLKFSMTLEPYNFTNIYKDYVDTVKRLPDKSVFQPQIRSLDHVLGMHDIASSVYLLEKDEIERANWDKNVKKAVKWEYNDPDTDFIAVAPAEPSELALEGTVLGHCVKTYIPKVTDGITNVMFIRKKDEPKIPFFTVEIDNSEFIQQVHGQGNCNANTAPEILPFIDHWCKAKKLKKMSINKVR